MSLNLLVSSSSIKCGVLESFLAMTSSNILAFLPLLAVFIVELMCEDLPFFLLSSALCHRVGTRYLLSLLLISLLSALFPPYSEPNLGARPSYCLVPISILVETAPKGSFKRLAFGCSDVAIVFTAITLLLPPL